TSGNISLTSDPYGNTHSRATVVRTRCICTSRKGNRNSHMTPSYNDLKTWDHTYLWHPFTQMQEWLAEDPIIITRGEGNYLIDYAGKKYLDGVSSLWCNVHGHAHPAINAAISEQLSQIAHSTLLGLANVPSIQLAKQLVEIAPGELTRVFYSDAGATAVEIALKIAFQYWQ